MDLLGKHQPSEITALVRDSKQKNLLSPLGINVVNGTLQDIPLLSELVAASDVVFNFAVPFGGGDDSIQAIVDNLEIRAKSGMASVKPVLLQTSGSGSVLYGSDGEAGTDVWKVSGPDAYRLVH